MKTSQQPQGLFATRASVVTLLISAITVLAALENALENIWESTTLVPAGMKGWIRERLAARHAILVGSVGLIFRYMPAKELPWKVVAAGGILTAVLFDAGRWGIGLYLAQSTQPSAFGAAASFAALLLWLYYTAHIFLFGAEFTACLGKLSDHSASNDSGAAGKMLLHSNKASDSID